MGLRVFGLVFRTQGLGFEDLGQLLIEFFFVRFLLRFHRVQKMFIIIRFSVISKGLIINAMRVHTGLYRLAQLP